MNAKSQDEVSKYAHLVKIFLPVSLCFLVIALYYIFPDSTILYLLWLAIWLVVLPFVLFYYLFVYQRNRKGERSE